MIINSLIALPPSITSLNDVLPSYETNTIAWNTLTNSYVDTHGAPIAPEAEYLNGICTLQVSILSNLPTDTDKEIGIKIYGYDEDKSELGKSLIFDGVVKIGSILTTEGKTIDIFIPFFKIVYYTLGASPSPATGTLFTFKTYQSRTGIYGNY